MADIIAADYRDRVRRVFAGDEAKPVFNGTVDHAAIVIEEGFRNASKIVRLLTNRLNPACYEREAVVCAAQDFLRRPNTRLEILIENCGAGGCSETNHFLRVLGVADPSRVTVAALNPVVVESYPYNFMVVDDIGYRFEHDRADHTAVVAGGETNRAATEKLIAIFESLKSYAAPWASMPKVRSAPALAQV